MINYQKDITKFEKKQENLSKKDFIVTEYKMKNT